MAMEGIRAGQAVVGSDGVHVGTVDEVEGGRIKFSREDPDLHGIPHYLRGQFVDSIDGDVVHLNIPAGEATANLQAS